MPRRPRSSKRPALHQTSTDPHRARESHRYERPIASREFILQTLADEAAPLGFDALAESLGLVEEVDREALTRRLAAMEREGQLLRNRRGGYCPVDRQEFITGRVLAHPDGYGFLRVDSGGDDLFLSAREMRRLLHEDRIVARLCGVDRRGRGEAMLVEVLERGVTELVGRFHREGGLAYVIPDDRRYPQLAIPPEGCAQAVEGQMVVAAIVRYADGGAPASGRVTEVLGEHMDPGLEIEISIRSHALPNVWPEGVLEEIATLSEEVPERAKSGRHDLRSLPLVTIDGEDARDFDDAVWCERRGEGYRLIVAIADVSSYVHPGMALDTEAAARGNSVYFPARVVPMLPEVLSNGLCSLNPEVDRLAMACEMSISDEGRIVRSRFFEAVMRSQARLTYTEVAGLLSGTGRDARKALMPHLESLHAVYTALRRQREQRGAIDFETTETRIVFGADRKIERIEAVERNDAHRLIEECMLAANVCAARFLLRKRMGCLYRVHDGPSADKLADLRTFLGEFALSLGGGDKPEPAHYSALLEKIRARPDRHLIETVLLRSLAQAVYSPENRGHFGLAMDEYAHFTSPIRRYPDLVVHRAIRHVLAGGQPESFVHGPAELYAYAEHCSMTERRADEATRGAIDWLKCEFMRDRVGEVFTGTVGGVTGFGLFVELDEVYVTGLVHVTSLGRDYYHFDAAGHRLEGKRTGQRYRLGDRMRVKIARVDLDQRRIDLLPAEEGSADSGRRRKPR